MKKVRDEIKKVVIEPYLAQNPHEKEVPCLSKILDYDTLNDLTFYSNCFTESMRIEPAVASSSFCQLTETCQIGKYTFKAGQAFTIEMTELQHLKEEWIEPGRYIPERFDPSSKYFLTPAGNKRHPMSFGAFLGGKRICLGKTFAEATSKVIGPTLLAHFDFEFVDPAMMTSEKPVNNLVMVRTPVMMVKVTGITL
jgi:cytochrome P450